MALLTIRVLPDPILYKKSDVVNVFNASLRSLIHDMFTTMYSAHGVGLAAVQVGLLKRVMVIDLEPAGFIKSIFINPEVIEESTEMDNDTEGCLSVPGIVANLARPSWVKIKYQDIMGKEKQLYAKKLMARAVLHEIDHMDGKVFVDSLEPDMRYSIQNDLNDLIKYNKVHNPQTPSYRTK